MTRVSDVQLLPVSGRLSEPSVMPGFRWAVMRAPMVVPSMLSGLTLVLVAAAVW